MLICHRIAFGRFVALAIPAFVIALGCWPAMTESAEFALTRDGKPAVTIVIAAVPTPAATFGAQELQLHVQKITGATLPIVYDTEQVASPRILLGPSAATSQPDLDASQFEDQEYLIRFLDNDLVLLGKEQATSYAVHDFLERFCNVRWYGPGDSQMVFPETHTLVVEPREVRRRPAFLWRTMFPWTQFKTARELTPVHPVAQGKTLEKRWPAIACLGLQNDRILPPGRRQTHRRLSSIEIHADTKVVCTEVSSWLDRVLD